MTQELSDATIETKLSQLGYSPRWLEYGILTENALNTQYADRRRGDDPNTEHYRYKIIVDLLNTREHFDNHTIANILELMQADADRTMAVSVLHSMLKNPKLSDYQLNMVVRTLQTLSK